MGWTVLYIAFGIVALWLLGEVLLQYKARLRWRLVAFFGFLTVVLGVLMRSVPVIGAGAIAFALGQTYVTLSYRSGFSSGWSIPNAPAWARRRDAEGYDAQYGDESAAGYDEEYRAHDDRAPHEPVPAPPPAPGFVPGPAGQAEVPGDDVYTPQPMPDETGQYGIYDAAHQTGQQENAYAGYEGYPGYTGDGQGGADPYGQDVHAAGGNTYGDFYPGGQETPDGQGIYTGGQDTYEAAGYDYSTGQYTGYADPYGQQQYDQYDPYGGYGQGYDTGQYADPYQAQQYGTETPPGGVWVPQQREGEQPQAAQQADPYQADYQNYEAYQPGYDGQYRY